ncbi:MAG: glycosyltransferase family 4 protein [candidate division WOR-3 bacterium]
MSPKKFKIFPYGIKLNEVKPRRSPEDIRTEFGWQGKFIIGTAARIDPLKRLEYLIEGFYNLRKKDDCLLVIMGTGNKNYEIYLKNLVKNYNLQNYVQFLGYRNDVYDILNTLNIFVLPSPKEPFGLALLEAMALGIPSIVFADGGGAVDILGDGGIIVNSVEELARAIERLKEDSELRERLSKNVKERARLFDISFTAENLYNIYYELLSAQPLDFKFNYN